MWAIKWFMSVILILVILGFALQNSEEAVSVALLTWKYDAVQLWMVIYISFGLGVLFWLMVSIFQVLELKNVIRRLKKNQHEMESELDSLRNLSIGDDDAEFGLKEEGV